MSNSIEIARKIRRVESKLRELNASLQVVNSLKIDPDFEGRISKSLDTVLNEMSYVVVYIDRIGEKAYRKD